jgi:secondary thiamine-phosphate synthase enzyme
MMIHRINLKTNSRTEFQDITAKIREVVVSDGTQNGLCHVFVLHTTAAITINECADPDVVADISAKIDSLIPEHGTYRHVEGNSPAHIKASMFGASETLIVENGNVVLGTWQGVFFCEFDGPRERTVLIRFVSE